MKPIKEILPDVLTQMQALTTKVQGTHTQTPPQGKQPNDLTSPNFQSFQTLKDPQLERMLAEAELFLSEIKNCLKPRWLSFVGTSGTGKTFLSEIIYREVLKTKLCHHHSLINGVGKDHWPKVVRKLRDGEYWRIDELIDLNFLFLDEIGSAYDSTGFATDGLMQVMLQRVGKWTITTSNKKLVSIASDIDVKLASRMIRDGSVVVEVDTTDFALR